jgi:hypothetical protein
MRSEGVCIRHDPHAYELLSVQENALQKNHGCIMSFYEIWGECGLQALGSSEPIEFSLI